MMANSSCQLLRPRVSAAVPAGSTRDSSLSRMSRRLARASASSSITSTRRGVRESMVAHLADRLLRPLVARLLGGQFLECVQQLGDIKGLVAYRVGSLGDHPAHQLVRLGTVAG